MTSYPELLRYGPLGLALGLFFLAYCLQVKEQNRSKPRARVLGNIRFFITASIVLVIVVQISNVASLFRGPDLPTQFPNITGTWHYYYKAEQRTRGHEGKCIIEQNGQQVTFNCPFGGFEHGGFTTKTTLAFTYQIAENRKPHRVYCEASFPQPADSIPTFQVSFYKLAPAQPPYEGQMEFERISSQEYSGLSPVEW